MHVLQESIALQTVKSQSEASETNKNHKSNTSKPDEKILKRKQSERETPKRKIDSKRRKLKRSMNLTEEGSNQLNSILMSDD